MLTLIFSYSIIYIHMIAKDSDPHGEVYLEKALLPSTLPDITFTIPSGRLNQVAGLINQIDMQCELEEITDNRMVLISVHGHPSAPDIARAFADITNTLTPIYLMTAETNEVLLRALEMELPEDLRDSSSHMRVVSNLVNRTEYVGQRTKLMLPFSNFDHSQHENLMDIGLDDDLAFGKVPLVRDPYRYAASSGKRPNEKMYVPRHFSLNGDVSWHNLPLISPYKNIGDGHIPSRQRVRGINGQNTALGQGEFAVFQEDVDDQSPVIAGFARYAIAVGQKWNNPDVEAIDKLRSDIGNGGLNGEISLEAILTTLPETVGYQTHDVNMDPAHMARYWKSGVIDMLPWLGSNPEISDKYGTMSRFDPITRRSTTLGMRAEMWLLVGPNGLLKQLSDEFGQTYLAAQTAAVFEHKRLGGSIRTSEVVAAFSEKLGLTLGDIVRENIIIDKDTMTLDLIDLSRLETIVGQNTVQQIHNSLHSIIQEIDMLTTSSGHPLNEDQMLRLLGIREDISQRLRLNEGFDSFYTAVNEELKEQYEYQRLIVQVFPHLLRAGARVRRKGEFPVIRVV